MVLHQLLQRNHIILFQQLHYQSQDGVHQHKYGDKTQLHNKHGEIVIVMTTVSTELGNKGSKDRKRGDQL